MYIWTREKSKGLVWSEEARIKKSTATSGENNPMYGKKRENFIGKANKTVTIEGVTYISINEAHRKTGLSKHIIRKFLVEYEPHTD